MAADPLAAAAARHAARLDDVFLLTKYLDDGGSVESCDNYQWSLLQDAVYHGSINCSSVLLDRGANVNAANGYGSTPLHKAALRGYIEALTLLLDRGGENIDAADNDGWTPLHCAILYGHVDCVQLLLERGANRDIVNADGHKPINLCDRIDNWETAEQIEGLLQGGGQATKAAKPRSLS